MMEFAPDKPIYRQIVDYCCQHILSGEWPAAQRIPSTKELSVALAVNNRTVMKAFDDLHAAGVIYQKRGVGYFVADTGATDRINALMRAEFLQFTLPEFITRMRMAGLTAADILPLLPR